ncbi:hypothetical protein HK413_08760 [Mucilaginibacter sp. S1162]|uniref:Membrane transport protein MMPL domain-containing protein n=1 Tax=Mucilaginibacter humi TaxID=2732510 RepID=A0ABX1W6V6_9SPHI|nr:hypothetical protein [Mucilaginibacter humi]NNU34215.1 hypothetical protein [Mucilaginibacter humi]
MLVLAVPAGVVTSLAVIVLDAAVFKVTLKVWVPATSAASAGSTAFASLDAGVPRL